MKASYFFALSLALTPSLVSAALFPKDTLVKMIDAKEFKKVMKENATSAVAFVAPWCGHCQKMAPEYSRAALGLYPMVPFYAVDCDKQSNKQLCAQQGVKGFPTIKLFPRGLSEPPKDFDGSQRTASTFFYWASRGIPHGVKKLYKIEDIPGWVKQNIDKPRALLLNQGKGIPLLWQTLGNKYRDQLKFAVHRDRKGKSSVKMGLEKGEDKSSKVLIYPAGSTDFVRYEGISKFDSLSKFFDSVVDGTADLTIVNEEAREEVFEPDEELLEIERKQEAQRMALAHGGFNDLIDFEEAIKQGHGKDFHAKNGFPGMMGGSLPKKGDAAKESAKKEEDPIRRILKAQQEAQKKEAEQPKMVKTGDGGQVVLEAVETGHPKTPVAEPTPTPEATPVVEELSEEDEDHQEELEEAAEAAAGATPVAAHEPLETNAADAHAETEHLKDEL